MFKTDLPENWMTDGFGGWPLIPRRDRLCLAGTGHLTPHTGHHTGDAAHWGGGGGGGGAAGATWAPQHTVPSPGLGASPRSLWHWVSASCFEHRGEGWHRWDGLSGGWTGAGRLCDPLPRPLCRGGDPGGRGRPRGCHRGSAGQRDGAAPWEGSEGGSGDTRHSRHWPGREPRGDRQRGHGGHRGQQPHRGHGERGHRRHWLREDVLHRGDEGGGAGGLLEDAPRGRLWLLLASKGGEGGLGAGWAGHRVPALIVRHQGQTPHYHRLTGVRLRLLPLVSTGQETLERLVVVAVARVSDGANIGLRLPGTLDICVTWGLGVFWSFWVDEWGPSSSEDIIDLYRAEIESDQMNGSAGGRPPIEVRVTRQNIVVISSRHLTPSPPRLPSKHIKSPEQQRSELGDPQYYWQEREVEKEFDLGEMSITISQSIHRFLCHLSQARPISLSHNFRQMKSRIHT